MKIGLFGINIGPESSPACLYTTLLSHVEPLMTIRELAEAIDRPYVEDARARYDQLFPEEGIDSFILSLPGNKLSATEMVILLANYEIYDQINHRKLLDLYRASNKTLDQWVQA